MQKNFLSTKNVLYFIGPFNITQSIFPELNSFLNRKIKKKKKKEDNGFAFWSLETSVSDEIRCHDIMSWWSLVLRHWWIYNQKDTF